MENQRTWWMRGAASLTMLLCATTTTSADLIGVDPGFPLTLYDNQGVTTYSAAEDRFTVDSNPIAIQFEPNGPPRLILPFNGDEAVRIEAIIDENGDLVGGVPGDDFLVIGQVDLDGDGQIDAAGVLITGEVADFGFLDSSMKPGVRADRLRAALTGDEVGSRSRFNMLAAAGLVDQYDFRVTVTGGMLAPLYEGADIGVAVTSEMSTFNGVFTKDFEGEAKGTYGPIDPLTGACCLPSGECEVATQAECETAGGVYQGDGVACSPSALGEPGEYRLRNHPASEEAPPGYGLRLDELFDVTSGLDIFTFDFDAPESDVRLTFDGVSLRIFGTAIGGRDTGAGYDPDWTSLIDIDFTYDLAVPAAPDDDLIVLTPSGTNTGTVTWLETGDTFALADKAIAPGFTFRFGDEDDDQGHLGFPGVSGWGWLTVDGVDAAGAQDWLFTAESICLSVVGACCLFDGTCIEVTEDECAMQGGDFQGVGVGCDEVDCPARGACCLFDGTCIEVTEEECAMEGGDFQGVGTRCADIDCPARGACCLFDGTCIEVTEEACAMQGGDFQGVGTRCADVDCPGNGACCLFDGTCIETTMDDCVAQGGDFQGVGTTCADVMCVPLGACCLEDGSCVEVSAMVCGTLGGDFQGDGVPCADVVCEPMLGACCLPDGTCIIATPSGCDAEGGDYQGDDTQCTPEVLGEPGVYRLRNHPDGNQAAPFYGLRLDELFDVTSGNDVFTFDFETPESDMRLIYDGVSIRIVGTAFGGRDIGAGYDPDYTSLIEVDFTYDLVGTADPDDDLIVTTPSMTNSGTVTWLATGETFVLSDKANDEGFTFRFGDEDDDMGHRGFPGLSGWGWLKFDHPVDSGTRDFIFTAESICTPPPPTGACCLPGGMCVETTADSCAAQGGQYFGDGVECADVDCNVVLAGACCLFDGTCIVATAAECAAADGVYQGDGVSCDDVDCPPLGACCLFGACFETAEFDCVMQGGEYQGDGVRCSDVDCSIVGQDCCENGKPRALVFQYTGEDCSATSHAQDPDKVDCEGDPMLASPVFIIANDDEDPDDGKIWFQGEVALDELFVIDAANAGDDDLSSETFIHIFDLDGNLLQFVEFHTSCSQPLEVGYQFGANLLIDCIGSDEPIPGDCCENGDKPAALTFVYTGDDCSATNHQQDPDKVDCEGDPMLAPLVHIIANNKENPNDGEVWFEGDVALDGEFTLLASNANKDELSSETFIHIYSPDGDLLQQVEFHTSCSQPLAIGFQFGAALLVDCGEDAGPPPGDDCCENGKPRVLSFQYTGEDCSASNTMQDDGKWSCAGDPAFEPMVRIRVSDDANPDAGDALVYFDAMVELGDVYDADAAAAGEDDFKTETFIHIFDLNDVLLQSVEFHTSCSQPIFLGDQYGANLLVGCIGANEPIPGQFCDDGVKIETLTVRYTGEDCSASSTTQDDSKWSCTGDPAFETMVHIIANDDEDPDDGDIWFEGVVALDGLFVIDAGAEDESRLSSETWIHVMSLDGDLLQQVRFHTSCSQPLNQDDQFGGLLMVDFTPEDD